MSAGIPPDPGKSLLANINAQGQVTLSRSQQFQVPNNGPIVNAGVGAVGMPQEGSSSSIIDAMPLSTPQGDGTPTPSHLPVEAPPATQLSPSAPISLSALGTQVSLPSSTSTSTSTSFFTPGSLAPTTLASSSRSSASTTSIISHSSAIQPGHGSAERPGTSSSFSTTTLYAASIAVASVSIRTTSITISTKINTSTSVSAPTSMTSQLLSVQAQPSGTPSSTPFSEFVSTSMSTVHPRTSSLIPHSSSSVRQTTRLPSTFVSSSFSVPLASTAADLKLQTTTPSASGLLSSLVPSSSSVTPSSTPASAQAANLNVHDPPFYIGIALGVIVGVAFFFVFVAWCFRFRRRTKKRRLQNPIVPWGSQDGDEETGTIPAQRVSTIDAARNLGSLEDLAHMRTWEPRGDRDVGEPRRVFVGPGYPSIEYPSEESLASVRSSAPLRPRNTIRQLPSHLVNTELASHAREESYFGRFAGLKREGLDPRSNPYLGHQLDDASRSLGVERPAESAQRTLTDRLRKVGNPTTMQWDRLPTPGKDQPTEDFEPWAASIRASLASAFNTIASGLSSKDDKFTAAPSRHNLTSDHKESTTTSTRTSIDEPSKTWTLEEKGDGADIVHFLPPLDKDSWKKPKSDRKPTLSFADGEKISTYDEAASSLKTTSTRESQVPLVASSIPEKVVIKGQPTMDSRTGVLSRESSVYSTISTPSSGSRRFTGAENGAT